MKPADFLFLEITSECNLRCKQCHLWRSTEAAGTLTTAEKVALVEQFAAWSPRGTLVLTGGETMRKKDEFYALSQAGRSAGITVAANTNGTLITPDETDRLLRDGPRYLVVSLDSHRKEIHDFIRGEAGVFDQVVSTLIRLGAAKVQNNSDVRLMVNLIVCDLNYRELDRYLDFVFGLGIDGAMFQALSRTFWIQTKRDAFFDRYFPKDVDAFDQAIDSLIVHSQSDERIASKRADLEWMKLYVRNPDFIGEQVCGSHERNMMVDAAGEVQLCFSMRSLTQGKAIGNVRQSTLQELWMGGATEAARLIMEGCRRNCGMLHCHRKIA